MSDMASNGGSGIEARGEGVRILVSGGTFSGNGRHGIHVSDGAEALIENVTAENNVLDGLRIADPGAEARRITARVFSSPDLSPSERDELRLKLMAIEDVSLEAVEQAFAAHPSHWQEVRDVLTGQSSATIAGWLSFAATMLAALA